MMRSLPAALLHHPSLTQKQRDLLADVRYPELHPAQLADLGRLVEAIIRLSVPDFRSYYAPIPFLPPARALITDQLREENGFTESELETGKEAALTASPARLLALYFRVSTTRRTRQTARLLAAAEQVSRNTNTPIVQASQLSQAA